MTHLVRRPGGREGSGDQEVPGEMERQTMEGGQGRPHGTGDRGFQETGRSQRSKETGVGVSLSPWKRGNKEDFGHQGDPRRSEVQGYSKGQGDRD